MRLLKNFIKNGYWLVPLLWCAAVAVMSPHFGSDYSPDSYYYTMLGRSIIGGHGYMTPVIRENMTEANFYSRAYPPVVPLLIGLTDMLLKSRISSGVIVDLLALYAMLHLCYLLGVRMVPRFFYVVPAACCMFTLSNGSFSDEIIAGRSIPVAAALFLMLLWLTTEEKTCSLRRCYAIGICTGLLYLTRFDTSLFCLVLPPFLCFLRGEEIRKCMHIYLGGLLAVLPWMVRNMMAFGHPLVSDNWMAVLSVFDSDMPTLLYFHNGIPSGLDYPGIWLQQRLFVLVQDIWFVVNALVPLPVVNTFGGLCVLFLCVYAWRRYRGRTSLMLFTGISLLWMITDIVTVAVTKLPDARYFSIAILLGTLSAVVVLATRVGEKFPLRNQDAPPLPSPHVSLPLAVAVIGISLYHWLPPLQYDAKAPILEKVYNDFRPFIRDGELVGGYLYADNFAYYSSWKMIYFPSNVTSPEDPDFIAWKEHFHVSYVIMMDKAEFMHYSRLKILARSGSFVLLDVKGSSHE